VESAWLSDELEAWFETNTHYAFMTVAFMLKNVKRRSGGDTGSQRLSTTLDAQGTALQAGAEF